MIEVAEAMATGWERAPHRERQRLAARRLGSNGSATSLSTADTLALGRSVRADHSHLGGTCYLMHPGGTLGPEAVSVIEPLRPGVLRDDPQGQAPVAGRRLHQVVSHSAALLLCHDVDRVELPGCWRVWITSGPGCGQPDGLPRLIERRRNPGPGFVNLEPQPPATHRRFVSSAGVQGLAPSVLPWRCAPPRTPGGCRL